MGLRVKDGEELVIHRGEGRRGLCLEDRLVQRPWGRNEAGQCYGFNFVSPKELYL
jgi:hypothetical protein